MIGIGIIGAGDFGARHARAMARVEGLRLVAASRRDPEGLAAFTAAHGGTGHADWRRVLDDPSVDVVLVATSHALHAEVAIAAAKAGKHVFLEKPMAPTVAECGAIISAAAESRITLMVGHIMHFAKPVMIAQGIIATGQLGRPVVGSSWLVKLWMEHNRRDWHLRRGSGGGMLMTAGIHALDQLIWLMDDAVTSVGAIVTTGFHAQEADDTALLSLRFARGGTGQVQSVGYLDGAGGFGVEIVCEGGTIRVDIDCGVKIGRGAVWTAVPDSHDANWMDNALRREWATFRDCIMDSAPVPVTGDYARDLILVLDAARIADERRSEVNLRRHA